MPKITDLTELTSVAIDDYLPIVDTSNTSTTNKTKKVQNKNLLGAKGAGFYYDYDGTKGPLGVPGVLYIGDATGGTAGTTPTTAKGISIWNNGLPQYINLLSDGDAGLELNCNLQITGNLIVTGASGIVASGPISASHAAAGNISFVLGHTSQTTDIFAFMKMIAAVQVKTARINKDGYLILARTTVPADADVSAGEVALWLDQTIGATKMMFKAKDSGGTVRTGSVNLT